MASIFGSGKAALGLQRTFDPKYAHYMSDGQGRDTYIIRNNGGLCSEREPNPAKSTRYVTPRLYSGIPTPHKNVPSLRYLSNGSGRDSYILINSGGNHVDSVPGGFKSF
jgi:hypothetical protein